MIPRRHIDGNRKSWALAFVGLFFLGYAGSTLLDRPNYDPARAVLYEAIPVPVRVGLWFGSALVIFVCAANSRWSPIGWGAAMFMPLERLVSHFWSGMMFLIPGYPSGMIASGSYLLSWLALAALIRLIASWPEPEATVTPPQEPPHAA